MGCSEKEAVVHKRERFMTTVGGHHIEFVTHNEQLLTI